MENASKQQLTHFQYCLGLVAVGVVIVDNHDFSYFIQVEGAVLKCNIVLAGFTFRIGVVDFPAVSHRDISFVQAALAISS